jgi:hypothetical protein
MKTRTPPHQLPVSIDAPTTLVTHIGRLVEPSDVGVLWVDYPSNATGPCRARSTVVLDRPTIARAIEQRRGVVLQFEDGRADRPIVTGLLIDETPSELTVILKETARPKRVWMASGSCSKHRKRLFSGAAKPALR